MDIRTAEGQKELLGRVKSLKTAKGSDSMMRVK